MPTRYWEAAFRIAVFFLFFKQSHACFSLKNKQKPSVILIEKSLKNKQGFGFGVLVLGFGKTPGKNPALKKSA